MSKQRNRITKSGAGEASSKGVAPRVEKPGLIRKLSYARWVPAHAWQQLTRPTERGIVHLIFALADHFEASIVPENGRAGAPLSQQERRVKQWSSEYPRSVDRCRDHEGQPFVHTYFYPAEQYDRGLVDCLAEHCHGGWGELEVHLHHGMDGPDTAENTSQQLKGLWVWSWRPEFPAAFLFSARSNGESRTGRQWRLTWRQRCSLRRNTTCSRISWWATSVRFIRSPAPKV